MREKIRRWVEAVRTLAPWRQGAAGFVVICMAMLILSSVISLCGAPWFAMQITARVQGIADWIEGHGLLNVAGAVMMLANLVSIIMLSARKFDRSAAAKAAIICAIPSWLMQSIESDIEAFVVWAALLLVVAFLLTPHYKTILYTVGVIIASCGINQMMYWARMPDTAWGLNVTSLAQCILGNLDIWLLTIAIGIVASGIKQQREEVS